MRSVRIIPRLDIKGPNIVKGIHLEGLRVLGLPERFSSYYFHDNADELIYIDMVASLYGRNNLEEIVRRTAENVFIPITVGGGIRTIDDIRRLLRAGADKIAVNTAAIRNPRLLEESAKIFGTQCIVLSIQAMKLSNGNYEAYTDNARERSGLDVIEWAKQAVELGAGEILITSINREGTGEGYDLDLMSELVDSVKVPVISSGGAGSVDHVVELLRQCKVDAVSAASIFHYHAIKDFGVEKRAEGNVEYLKRYVSDLNPSLKRLKPISVSALKTRIMKSMNSQIKVRIPNAHKTHKISYRDQVIKKTGKRKVPVTLVDYGRSNLFSVQRALEEVGASVAITNDPYKILDAERLILSGVGAFGDAMNSLRDYGLIEPIREYVRRGKPLLGICLGMQLFMKQGEEFGLHEGLGLIPGNSKKLAICSDNKDRYVLPHTGWNQIRYPRNEATGGSWSNIELLKDISPYDSVYYIHSYVVDCENPENVVAETDYGNNYFSAVIREGNITGCQFHPERSGITGLKIYKNFILNY